MLHASGTVCHLTRSLVSNFPILVQTTNTRSRPSPETPGLIKASGNRSHSPSMVCYWLYAVIVCFKAIAFLHVSLVDARVHPKGMEIKSLKLCGSDHSNAKIEITPWPFIAYEHIFNVTISITPAVNIFEIIAAVEIIKLPGGQILFKSRRDVCSARDDWCTTLAGETFVFRRAYVMHDLLPGLSMTTRWTMKLYNEDLYEFLCVEAVASKS
ncbi:uncharacterized protein LOC114973864 isoform X1 [Acropora millepora]|uniref:uncharacterized protein LOC114973864 isoform X1 n=2 Tax=Acropora millepora TaxID=45264 RepID=UPI001CF2F337|nr:uncharacterized protein LOC114973864 isoform X1 [Acropora millepora]